MSAGYADYRMVANNASQHGTYYRLRDSKGTNAIGRVDVWKPGRVEEILGGGLRNQAPRPGWKSVSHDQAFRDQQVLIVCTVVMATGSRASVLLLNVEVEISFIVLVEAISQHVDQKLVVSALCVNDSAMERHWRQRPLEPPVHDLVRSSVPLKFLSPSVPLILEVLPTRLERPAFTVTLPGHAATISLQAPGAAGSAARLGDRLHSRQPADGFLRLFFRRMWVFLWVN
jgi:hypothetical protein